MKKKFLRRDAKRSGKFGKGKGKKAKWRRPTGRHNKMREKKKGYPAVVGIGNRTAKKTRGQFEKKMPVLVMNARDLEKIGKDGIGLIGKIGTKNKIEIAKKAKEMKIKLKNLNSESFLKKNLKSKEPKNSPEKGEVEKK
ncbi:MAG: eL32 family ribosomal protein [archaeon]|nr:eL32 family ribosomal protein [archaeon]